MGRVCGQHKPGPQALVRAFWGYEGLGPQPPPAERLLSGLGEKGPRAVACLCGTVVSGLTSASAPSARQVCHMEIVGLPWWLNGEEAACSAGNLASIPGSGRSPGEGSDNPLQYSCLGNPMDRGACQATVHGVTKELDMTWT